MSEVGPVLAGLELAARKLSALFSRAEARDFADVYVLCQQFKRSEIIDCSRHIDLGINDVELAEALRTIGRFRTSEIPLPINIVDKAVEFFNDWANELAN